MEFSLPDLLAGGAAGSFLQFLLPAQMSIAEPLRRADAEELWVWRAYLSTIATLLAVKCLNRESRYALFGAETSAPFVLARMRGFGELERHLSLHLAASAFSVNVDALGALLGARWWMQPPSYLGGTLAGAAYERLLICLVAWLRSAEPWRGSPRCVAASLWGRDGPADRWVSAAVYDIPEVWPTVLGPPPPGAIGGARWPDGSPRALLVDGTVVLPRRPFALGAPAPPRRPAGVSSSLRSAARSRSR
jgi:hypothetical protein